MSFGVLLPEGPTIPPQFNSYPMLVEDIPLLKAELSDVKKFQLLLFLAFAKVAKLVDHSYPPLGVAPCLLNGRRGLVISYESKGERLSFLGHLLVKLAAYC